MSKSRSNLTAKESVFVDEFLIDLNGTQAAIRAGYSAKTARQLAARLLSKVNIQNAIAAARAARQERTKIEADDVVRYWAQLMTADASEVVRYERTCCRHCYGKKYKRQWIDQDEFFEAELSVENEKAKLEKSRNPMEKVAGRAMQLPTDEGGYGFDPRKPPVADCTKCWGKGEESIHIEDTRSLSAQSRLLYAGVKQGKSGVEIKINDQFAASIQLARHLGMFNDNLTLKGDEENPLHFVASLTPKEKAAKLAALFALAKARKDDGA